METSDRSAGDFIAGFLDDYFAECDEHLTVVRRILLAADSVTGCELGPAAVEFLFRSFHSLKGLSGMVELRDDMRRIMEKSYPQSQYMSKGFKSADNPWYKFW